MTLPTFSTNHQEQLSTSEEYSRSLRSRKRRILETEDHTDQPPTLTMEPVPVQGYVEAIAAKFPNKINKPLQATSEGEISDYEIRMRLLRHRSPCDVHSFSCNVPMCGRSFTSLEVLAFHVSYAHQDVSRPMISTVHNTCLICGLVFDSAKGKIAHLTTRHKKLAAEHNSECLEQREPVISPHAPAAIRLEETSQPQSRRPQETDVVYNNSTLSDICDMIVIPHVEEF